MAKKERESVVNCPAFNLSNELTVQCPVCLEEHWASAKWTSSEGFETAVVEYPVCGTLYRLRYEVKAYVTRFEALGLQEPVPDWKWVPLDETYRDSMRGWQGYVKYRMVGFGYQTRLAQCDEDGGWYEILPNGKREPMYAHYIVAYLSDDLPPYKPEPGPDVALTDGIID